MVLDLLNKKYYGYVGHENHKLAPKDSAYVIGLNEEFGDITNNIIFNREGLQATAQYLNRHGRNINVPSEELCKVKRKK